MRNTQDVTTAITHVRSGAAVDLVVSDEMMPGGELLHSVRSISVTTPFPLVSGYVVRTLDVLLTVDT